MTLGRIAFLGAFLGLATSSTHLAFAQFSQVPDVPQSAWNSAVLRPPSGAKVAIVEFDDMQCPMCAAWNPILMQAAAKYHVAWIRHDFLIPGHPLSAQEAVIARWLDAKSEKLGAEYRNTIFAEQKSIETQEDLKRCTQVFARHHDLQLPFVIDPQGKLIDAVHADCRLASTLGVHETPTVYIVTAGNGKRGYSFARLTDLNLLFTYLERAKSATNGQVKVKSGN